MKIHFEPEAQTELNEAAAWYGRRREGLGSDLIAEVGEALEKIAESPFRHSRLETLPDEPNVRRVLLRRFPYAVVYEIAGDEIRVVAVSHTGRRPNYWLAR